MYAPEGRALLCGLKLTARNRHVNLRIFHGRRVDEPAVSGCVLVNLDTRRVGRGEFAIRKVGDLKGHTMQTHDVFIRHASVPPPLNLPLRKPPQFSLPHLFSAPLVSSPPR